ncbi:hypothetical protein CM49_02486 [Paenibacillus sp. P1XP2]|nr:hypothetical protein CM49_02486 [Paenibacillus sp. P1XP2]
MNGSADGDGESALYLPAGPVKKAKDGGLSIIVSAPGFTVTMPAASIPERSKQPTNWCFAWIPR